MPNPIAGKTVRLVYCLSIDLIGSTQAGLELATSALDRFNTNLVEQLNPHLAALELTDVLVKFTGDGWLIMTDDTQQVPALCCLATIMVKRFQVEMGALTDIAERNIPALRVAVCSGRDLRVELSEGRLDWVGDSARRAVRASQFCAPNEVLINETVRDIVFRDFDLRRVTMSEHEAGSSGKQSEEDFPLYVLGQLNAHTVVDSNAPECYVNTLSIIGRQRDALRVAEKVSERLESQVAATPEPDQERLLRKFNRLLATRVDYETGLAIVKNIRDSGLEPDVVTYNTLINLAPDYDQAKKLLTQMRAESIAPDVVTYSTLINLAPDYDRAKKLLTQMRAELIEPDVVTYNTLINFAPDYDQAKKLLTQMRTELIGPDVVTYNTLVNLAPDYGEAKTLLTQMRAELIQPNVGTYNTLIHVSHDYHEAKMLLTQMRAELIQPNVVTYNTLVNLAPYYDEAKMLLTQMRAELIQPNVETYNTLMHVSRDYHEAKKLLTQMRAESIAPDVVTYNTLINLASDNDEAKMLLTKMRAELIQPNVITYNTLVNLAPDYDKAKMLLTQMRAELIEPDVITYNTLINLAPDFDEAKALLRQMHVELIRPDDLTYSTLFSKKLKLESASVILPWYWSQAYHPEVPVQALIASYRRSGQLSEALYCALHYAHLSAARSVIRRFESEALAYFKAEYDENPNHPSAAYALGVALMELGKGVEARPFLEKALRLATAKPRQVAIRRWLSEIRNKSTPK